MRGLSLVSLALFVGCGPQLSEVPDSGGDAVAPSADPVAYGSSEDASFQDDGDVIEFPRSCGSELSDDEVEVRELQFDLDRGIGLAGVPQVPVVFGGTINLYWHVIKNGNSGNLTQQQVDDQVAVLNAAYASTGWSFTLVSTDWTNDASWFGATDGSNAENNMKTALRQGSGDDLNVYSLSPGFGLLGWSTFPSDYAARPTDDGVVIHYGTMPGGNQAPYDEGDTLVHETGHWMGLYHTFQNACRTTGDRVNDTPSERSANYGCPANRDSCATKAGLDPVQNYMDYSEDSCMYEFTPDQDYRMDDQFSIYRYLH